MRLQSFQLLLLAAIYITCTDSTFLDLGHLDLIHPIDFWQRYKEGFKITSVWKPPRCPTGVSKPGDYLYQDYVGELRDGTVFDTR